MFRENLVTGTTAPRYRWLAWLGSLTFLVALGLLRTSTDAEYAFASAAILPVILVAWLGGRREGLIMAILAAGMWVGADLLAHRQFSANWVPMVNGLTRLGTYVLIAYLTSKLKELLLHEQEMASQDALTGLLNRRAFFAEGEAEVDRSRRYGHGLAVAFLDLDDFKQLNDRQGHQTGDQALKAVSKALREAMRSTDRIARLGGDEFAVLLPEINYSAAAEAGQKIGTAIDMAMRPFPPVGVSVGVVWFDQVRDNFPAMLNAADDLMYEIKQHGKHGVQTRQARSLQTAL
jgi:diguanylate cyclase (GGDEF)-like protein